MAGGINQKGFWELLFTEFAPKDFIAVFSLFAFCVLKALDYNGTVDMGILLILGAYYGTEMIAKPFLVNGLAKVKGKGERIGKRK